MASSSFSGSLPASSSLSLSESSLREDSLPTLVSFSKESRAAAFFDLGAGSSSSSAGSAGASFGAELAAIIFLTAATTGSGAPSLVRQRTKPAVNDSPEPSMVCTTMLSGTFTLTMFITSSQVSAWAGAARVSRRSGDIYFIPGKKKETFVWTMRLFFISSVVDLTVSM